MDTNTFLLIAIGCLLLFMIIRPTAQNENFNTSRPYVTMTGTNPIRQRASPITHGHQLGGPYPPNYYSNHRRRDWNQFPYYGSNYYQPSYYDTGYYYENPYSYADPAESTGMYTSVYPDVCSRYGSSTMNVDPATYYMGSAWCPVGIAQSVEEKERKMYALEARFIGNSWGFRVRDNISQLYIYLTTVGTGPYGAFRDGDKVDIPGKAGHFSIQIQTQHNPYLLYLPN